MCLPGRRLVGERVGRHIALVEFFFFFFWWIMLLIDKIGVREKVGGGRFMKVQQSASVCLSVNRHASWGSSPQAPTHLARLISRPDPAVHVTLYLHRVAFTQELTYPDHRGARRAILSLSAKSIYRLPNTVGDRGTEPRQCQQPAQHPPSPPPCNPSNPPSNSSTLPSQSSIRGLAISRAYQLC